MFSLGLKVLEFSLLSKLLLESIKHHSWTYAIKKDLLSRCVLKHVDVTVL